MLTLIRGGAIPALRTVSEIRAHGWAIVYGCVLPGHLAMVDCWRQEVVLPEDFEARLSHPELAHEVANWVLAHELAHLVLHQDQIRKGIRTEAMERAAATWALEWLLPHQQLADHPDIRALAGEATLGARWKRMARAAEAFRLPTTAVDLALSHYQGQTVATTVREVMVA